MVCQNQVFRQILCYLVELFRQIACYLVELFRKIGCYFWELFCQIAFRKHLTINVTKKIGITNLVVTIKPMAVTTKLVVSAYFYESCLPTEIRKFFWTFSTICNISVLIAPLREPS